MGGNDIRELLRVLIKSLGMLEDIQTQCCDLSLSQCHTLVELGREGQLSVNELANLLELDKSTTSRHAQSLVKKGMLDRQESEVDRRYLDLVLSDKGVETFKTIEDNMTKYYNMVFDEIPDNKKEQVLESLELLIDAIKKTGCC